MEPDFAAAFEEVDPFNTVCRILSWRISAWRWSPCFPSPLFSLCWTSSISMLKPAASINYKKHFKVFYLVLISFSVLGFLITSVIMADQVVYADRTSRRAMSWEAFYFNDDSAVSILLVLFCLLFICQLPDKPFQFGDQMYLT